MDRVGRIRWVVCGWLMACGTLTACGTAPAEVDAGVGIDASRGPDSGTDGGTGLDADGLDAGGLDADGLDAATDAGIAIDANEASDAGAPEPCTSPGTTETLACGTCGTVDRFCTGAGTWAYGPCTGDVDCPTPDACATPGTLETVACGMCGSQERFCSAAHLWEYGTCEGERACMPGTSRSAACGMCGSTTERCDSTCTWVASACTGEGTCAPGATTRTGAGCPAGQTRLLRCTDACALTEVVEPCTAPAMDAGIDAGRDAGIDAGRDGGRDAGRDAGPPGDAGPPPTTIGAIQRGEVAVGTHVILRGVVVTAARADTLWVQDPLGGTTYAGVKVYVGAAHGAVRNDRVDVEGVVHEYFDDTELVSATVTVVGIAPPIAPLALTVAQASTEPYEGMLVRLTGVSSYQYPYDCAVDNPLCIDADLWQVEGPTGILVYGAVYEDADWLSRVGATSVTGVMTWRFDRRRIQPRIGADLP